MKIGTRSLLFGAHQFAIHPLFLVAGWWQSYGWSRVAEQSGLVVSLRDPRLWIVFVIHDWGYWGLPNMDGDEGETHPEWAARVMTRWFGQQWGDFSLLHSRFYAKRLGRPFSRLCVADKLAVALEPWWFYLPRVWLSGELGEYIQGWGGRTSAEDPYTWAGRRRWHRDVVAYLMAWVAEHRDGRVDTWTREHGMTDVDRDRIAL